MIYRIRTAGHTSRCEGIRNNNIWKEKNEHILRLINVQPQLCKPMELNLLFQIPIRTDHNTALPRPIILLPIAPVPASPAASLCTSPALLDLPAPSSPARAAPCTTPPPTASPPNNRALPRRVIHQREARLVLCVEIRKRTGGARAVGLRALRLLLGRRRERRGVPVREAPELVGFGVGRVGDVRQRGREGGQRGWAPRRLGGVVDRREREFWCAHDDGV